MGAGVVQTRGLLVRGVARRYLTPGRHSLAWVVRDHFLFFALAIMGAVFLAPRYLVIAEYIVERYVLNLPVPRMGTSAFPYVPNMLIPLFFLFLITYFLKPRLRLGILLVLALPLTILAEGNFDVPSVGVYLVFVNTTFVVTVRNGSSERLGFSRKTIPIQS